MIEPSRFAAAKPENVMSRYADVRAGFPKPCQPVKPSRREEEENRRAELEALRITLTSRHPLSAEIRTALAAAYAELGGTQIDIAINAIEVVLAEGANYLREQSKIVPPPVAEGKPVKAPRPLYTSATLVRASAELRRLLDKRTRLRDEALMRVMGDMEIARMDHQENSRPAPQAPAKTPAQSQPDEGQQSLLPASLAAALEGAEAACEEGLRELSRVFIPDGD